MAGYGYEDFAIGFRRRVDRTYDVTAHDVAGGEAVGTFALPHDRQLVRAVRALGSTRDVGVDERTDQERTAQEVGAELATALLAGPVQSLFDAALQHADDAGAGLRIRLSLGDTPELLDVPWELLYRRPTFLASQRRTPVVRFLDVGEPVTRQRITGTVRILGVVANPHGLEPLDVAAERRRVEQALAAMVASGEVELDWLDPATPQSLRRTLRDGNYHVLHFVGHGGSRDGESVLVLEDERGEPAYVSRTVLVNLLGDQRSLCLALLNSCRGARATLTDPFAGVATSLVALGVSAVVAMQFAITDDAAIAFAEEFYTALIDRRLPVDAAVAEGRKAILTDVNEVEWATPVLFSQSRDGVLFDFNPPTPAPPPPSHRRRWLVGAAAGLVLLAAGGLVAALLADRRDDDPSTSSTEPDADEVVTGSSLGQYDLLPECPTPDGEGWTDLAVEASPIDVGDEPVRQTFELTGGATQSTATGRRDVFSVTVGVSGQSPSNPFQYWTRYDLAIGDQRLQPSCFSTLDADPIPAGTTGRVLVGFDVADSAPGFLLVEGEESSRGRFDLATT